MLNEGKPDPRQDPIPVSRGDMPAFHGRWEIHPYWKIGATAAALYFGPPLASAFIATAIMALAIDEVAVMHSVSRVRLAVPAAMVLLLGLCLQASHAMPFAFFVASLLGVAVTRRAAADLATFNREAFAASVAAALIASGTYVFCYFVLRGDPRAAWIAALTAGTVDFTARVIGRLARSAPAFPLMSPSKTLLGTFGGAACGMVVGTLAYWPEGPGLAALRAACVVSAAIAGDLFFASIKRSHAQKHFGTALGYQGGVCDRIGSIVFALNVVGFEVALRF